MQVWIENLPKYRNKVRNVSYGKYTCDITLEGTSSVRVETYRFIGSRGFTS